MRKLLLTSLATAGLFSATQAQTLFTYGNNAVDKSEFLRVYMKNSLSKSPDLSEAALKDYLNLYSLFKMKVKEAELQRIDTVPAISADLNNYRRQLAKNYLTDKEVKSKLLNEAYDRMKEDIRVAHILVSCPPMATSEDTAKAYAKIDSIYKQAMNGRVVFAELAKISDDKTTNTKGGDIGYITSMQTVYPFETAAYATANGKISKPFRTQFGFHIIKVLDRRPARGEVQVAQILIGTPKSKGEDGIVEAKAKTAEVVKELKAGTSFETLVTKYSEDKYSIENAGVMEAFGVGRMDPAFENAAFALKNTGDISDPIQTDYGFHIVKLIKKMPIKPYDSVRDALQRRIDNDGRSQVAQEVYFNKIKAQNGFKEYPKNFDVLVEKVKQIVDTGAKANMFTGKDYSNFTQPLFEIGGRKFLQNDFMNFAENLTRGRLNGSKNAVIRDIYRVYVDRTVNDFEENRVADTNPDFKNLLSEYRSGNMLFELTDRNVWGKASNDTVGLKAFYEQNKNKYQWQPGFKGVVYKFKDEASMKEGVKLLSKNNKLTDEDLYKKLNSEKSSDAVNIQHGRYEYQRFNELPKEKLVKGKISEAVKNEDGSYTVVRVDETFAQPSTKTLEEAKGYVVAEYQDYLEKEWNNSLRSKYPVKVDDAVFKSMIK